MQPHRGKEGDIEIIRGNRDRGGTEGSRSRTEPRGPRGRTPQVGRGIEISGDDRDIWGKRYRCRWKREPLRTTTFANRRLAKVKDARVSHARKTNVSPPWDAHLPPRARNHRVRAVARTRRLVLSVGPRLRFKRSPPPAALVRGRNVENGVRAKTRNTRTDGRERRVRIESSVEGAAPSSNSCKTSARRFTRPDRQRGEPSSAITETFETTSQHECLRYAGQASDRRRGSCVEGKSTPLAGRDGTKGSVFPWIGISRFRCPPFVSGPPWTSRYFWDMGRIERGAYESTLDRRSAIVVLCFHFTSNTSRVRRR